MKCFLLRTLLRTLSLQKPLQAPSKNPSRKHLVLENLLRTLLRSVLLHDPLGVHPTKTRFPCDSGVSLTRGLYYLWYPKIVSCNFRSIFSSVVLPQTLFHNPSPSLIFFLPFSLSNMFWASSTPCEITFSFWFFVLSLLPLSFFCLCFSLKQISWHHLLESNLLSLLAVWFFCSAYWNYLFFMLGVFFFVCFLGLFLGFLLIVLFTLSFLVFILFVSLSVGFC